MAYVRVHNRPVYLSRARSERARDAALQHWDLARRGASRIRFSNGRSKDAKEADALVLDWLQREAMRAPDEFETDWRRFAFVGDEARKEATDLLVDYCDYSGQAWVGTRQDDATLAIAGMLGADMLSFPGGQHISLVHKASPVLRWSWPPLQFRYIEIMIDVFAVIAIDGTLDDFMLWTDSFALRCSEHIHVLPRVSATAPQP